ncbi:hypothetical protein L1987_29073 [Smallanthus sonchifolius]|uniref:Uncharacterized protein n=1 Tax=Smallanthus sonchifolius TaxID=185202 RepID=A0ACB9I075_9ASTR|nr:hypothetical protein L1987_29073 [Smallanthus sonchifolius]
MNLSSSSSSSSSSSKRKRDSGSFDEFINLKRPKNDVFMNYAFEDIGKSFISHLQGALRRNGFTISDHTFVTTDEELVKKAIEESEIYVEAFQAYKTDMINPERVQKWKQALKEAGELSGLTLQNGSFLLMIAILVFNFFSDVCSNLAVCFCFFEFNNSDR